MYGTEQFEDLLGMDQSPTKKARASSSPELCEPQVHFEHFVCKYDPAWDYVQIAESLFDGPRCLVVLEKLSSNAHVHFQGETYYAKRTFANKRAALAPLHFMRKISKTSRPVQRASKCDELGFQYIVKEGEPKILYVKGFTEEDINLMRYQSEEHVRKLKTTVKDWVNCMELRAGDFHGDEEEHKRLFNRVYLECLRNIHSMGKDPSRYTRSDIAKALAKHDHCSDSMKTWMMWKNLF